MFAAEYFEKKKHINQGPNNVWVTLKYIWGDARGISRVTSATISAPLAHTGPEYGPRSAQCIIWSAPIFGILSVIAPEQCFRRLAHVQQVYQPVCSGLKLHLQRMGKSKMKRSFKTHVGLPFFIKPHLLWWHWEALDHKELETVVTKAIATEENTFLICRRAERAEGRSTPRCSKQQGLPAFSCILAFHF